MPVFGVTHFGGYATHVCVPANQLYPIPPESKFSSDQWAAFPAVFLSAFNLAYLFDQSVLLQESMQTMIKWVEAGKVKTPPLQTFTFQDVAQAHQTLESGTTVGKLILKIPI